MTYITSVEEVGIEKGRVTGLLEGNAGILDLKLGEAAQSLIPEIQAITELDTLARLKAAIKPAQSLDEVRRVYAPTIEI